MSLRPALNCLPQLRRAALIHDGSGLTDGQLLCEFVRERDDAAFASLVKRHATMVFGVCRRLVRDTQIAEDAFQAVFLVLARKAASVRPREQVGNWLYGVAFRTALKARAGLARRRSKEKQVPAMPHPEVLPTEAWHDVQAVLDEELARLPDNIRSAIVLCDLEGRPQREAAKQLGLPLTTLANRLASARRLLAERLTKRGIVLSGGALATTIAANAAHGSVPPLLVAAASRMAGVAACSGTAAATVSAQIVQLSEGVMRMMFLGKLRTLTCCLVASLLLAGGGFHMATLSASEPDNTAQSKQPATPSTQPPKSTSRLDDSEYLRRICLDLRGQLPTVVETGYFVVDSDANKRSKVVEWLIEEKDAKAELEQRRIRLRLARFREAMDKSTADPLLTLTPRLTTTERITAADQLYDLRFREPQLLSAQQLPKVHSKLSEPLFNVTILDEGDEIVGDLLTAVLVDDSDVAFLQRACQDARGTAPTLVEIEYFKADKDPKKREKLLDLFLKDPAVAKKLGDAWKQKMMQPSLAAREEAARALATQVRFVAARTTLRLREQAVPAHLERLLDQLLKEKRSEAQMLEALSTATVGRLPTESEKKLVLANVSKLDDKRAAWREVVKTFASTAEAKLHAEELNPRPKQVIPEKK